MVSSSGSMQDDRQIGELASAGSCDWAFAHPARATRQRHRAGARDKAATFTTADRTFFSGPRLSGGRRVMGRTPQIGRSGTQGSPDELVLGEPTGVWISDQQSGGSGRPVPSNGGGESAWDRFCRRLGRLV